MKTPEEARAWQALSALSDEDVVEALSERGYVVVTTAQWRGVVDALGPASDDVLDLIFGEDCE